MTAVPAFGGDSYGHPSEPRPTVLHVEVVGLEDGSLAVSWELAGEGPVEVAVGLRPDATDQDPALRVQGTTHLTLRPLRPGRHYVSVAPVGGGSAVVAAERLVSLERGRNFRDLGGYHTAGGGRVRWGLVFRSASLHRLTAADLITLDRLGLRVVYDLRGDEERERAPSVLPDGVHCEQLPIGGTAAKTKELTDLVLAGRLAELPLDFLVRIYDAMVEVAAGTFGRLLTRLAEPDGRPALFHCHAGKDRTGIVAALLLSLLGVDERTVLDDYQLSGIHYTEHQLAAVQTKLAATGVDVERYRAVFGAPRHAMATVLAGLRERHGSLEAYLHDEAGVDHEVFAELRAALVQPAGRR